MNDTYKQGAKGMKEAQPGEGRGHPFCGRQRVAVMLFRRLMGVPMIVQVGVVLVEVGVLADDVRVRGGKLFAQPFGNAGQIEDAEQDEHEADRKFHGEADAGRDDQVKEDDGGADNHDGDGVAESPECTDEGSAAEGTFAADDGGDGDNVIGIGGMTHAEEETNHQDGDSAEHGKKDQLQVLSSKL